MLRRFAALVLGSALVLGGAALSAADAAGEASSFVAKANAERDARGLRPYAVKSDLNAVALRHSQRMASRNALYHNPNLGSEVGNWQVVGENVGNGGSVDSIHRAFMDSPSHRENILTNDYTEIGVGTVTDSRGILWVTQVFRKPYAAPAPTVSAPVTSQASRTVTRSAPTRPAVQPAAKPVVRPAKRVAPTRVAVPPPATAFLTALAPAAGALDPADPFAQAVAFTQTMAALTR